MKCEKCSTPIISGETRCRFCGFTNTNKNQNVEIINEQPEIIEPEEELLDQIIDIEQPKVIKGKKIDLEDIIEIKNEIDVNDELEKTTTLEKINIEDFTGKIDKEEVREIKEKLKESKKEKKEALQLVVKEETKKVQNEVKEKKINENANLYISIGVLSLLVLVFSVTTGYLFINRNVYKKAQTEKISSSLKGFFFDNYELSLPDNWLQKNEDEKDILMVFDETYEWGASFQVVGNVDFKKIDEKKEEISTNYSKNRYIFTSNYTKTVNDKEFFLYKGKYDAYSVYLIMSKMNDSTILVSDLKFKGEVDKDVLDEILKSISEIKTNDLEKLYETNFEFSTTGEILKEQIQAENNIGG